MEPSRPPLLPPPRELRSSWWVEGNYQPTPHTNKTTGWKLRDTSPWTQLDRKSIYKLIQQSYLHDPERSGERQQLQIKLQRNIESEEDADWELQTKAAIQSKPSEAEIQDGIQRGVRGEVTDAEEGDWVSISRRAEEICHEYSQWLMHFLINSTHFVLYCSQFHLCSPLLSHPAGVQLHLLDC